MKISRSGDLVRGQACPKCGHLEVVYNGNYYCQHCDWAMTKDVPRIIKAYLVQRLEEAQAAGNQWEIDRLEAYLLNYPD